NALDDTIVNRLVGKEPRAGGAALTLIVEDSVRSAGNRQVEIGVREHDRRRLAAELERNSLQIAGGRLDDQLADLGRAGEGDLIDVRMFGKCGAGRLAKPGHDVDDAVGNACRLDEFAEAQSR